MNWDKFLNGLIFAVLSLIWGGAYILIKIGLYAPGGSPSLSPIIVAALRVMTAGVVLLPFFIIRMKRYSPATWFFLVLSGLLSVLFPSYLFSVAETHLDSALAGTLNGLTPLFVLLLGYLFYRTPVKSRQLVGVAVAFAGIIFLLLLAQRVSFGAFGYAAYIFIATIGYALSALIVRNQLQAIPAFDIVTLSFVPSMLPALGLLVRAHFFSLPLQQPALLHSVLAVSLLGIGCSTLAWFFFYLLIKRSSALFASSVSFIVPFVALLWGKLYGETISLLQIGCMVMITYGVWLTAPKSYAKRTGK